MKIRSIRAKVALSAGALSSLVVVLFALLSAWRFYIEQIDVFDDGGRTQASAQQITRARIEVWELTVAYLLALPVVAVVAAAGAWSMAKRLTEPLTRLAAAAEGMEARTLHERLPETGGDDEMARLTGVLNGLLERLEKSFAQASRFAADASHELRTPLAIMRGSIEEAIRADPSARDAPLLASLLEENQRLAAIAEKLLFLARADAGKMIACSADVNLSDLIEDIAEDISILAEARGVSLQSQLDTDVFVLGDGPLLRQLLLNLFENAVNYNINGGWIRVRMLSEESNAVFSISNSSDGIPLEMQARLFERFFRVSDSRDRKSGGAGLGLSLCREIAIMHYGKLELASSDANGTIFRLTLPSNRPKVLDSRAEKPTPFGPAAS